MLRLKAEGAIVLRDKPGSWDGVLNTISSNLTSFGINLFASRAVKPSLEGF